MENWHDIYTSERENGLLMKPVDQSEEAKSNDDIMNRRLKNRERQRRYRARKRLEADMKKADYLSNSAPPEVQMQVNGTLNNCEARVLCRRNWKRDARIAHMMKHQEAISNGPVLAGLTSGNESQAIMFTPGAEAKLLLQNEHNSNNSIIQDNTERRIVPGRRHWKADARNKKH